MHSADTGGPPDTEQLHQLAVEAEQCLSQFATALGSAGAAPDAVHAVTHMADAVRTIATALAKGMKAQPAEQPHTMSSAADAMMADHHAAQAAAAGPPA